LNNPEEKKKEEAEETQTLPEITFAELPEKLKNAAGHVGWDSLMPVQRKAIPYLTAKKDVMMQARTGSGKTGAFLLPMLERLRPNKKYCQALILVPTRELARQVEEEAKTIMLIFDEADRMLSMGFYPDKKQVQSHLPRHDVNTCMFSATFPVHVIRAANEFMVEPEFISLSSDHIHVTDVQHIVYNVPSMDKDRTLIRLIELENPVSAIIFCNTKRRVNYVATILKRYGYDADELSSDLSQQRRERVLGRVRDGSLRFLVATDVAARGIDITTLSHVFQYEPPDEMEAYIHRSGRTGRAGASGIAMTLVYPVEKRAMTHISVRYKIEFDERDVPTQEDVEKVVAERAMVFLEASLRERDKLQADRSLRFKALAQKLSEGEDELPIITMLLDDYYQKMQHKFVPKIESKPKREKKPYKKKPSSNRGHGRRPRRR